MQLKIIEPKGGLCPDAVAIVCFCGNPSKKDGFFVVDVSDDLM